MELGDVLRLSPRTEDADSLVDSEADRWFPGVHWQGYRRGVAVDKFVRRLWKFLVPAKCSFVEMAETSVLELARWAGAKSDRSVAAYNSKVAVGFLVVLEIIAGLGMFANVVAADESHRSKQYSVVASSQGAAAEPACS